MWHAIRAGVARSARQASGRSNVLPMRPGSSVRPTCRVPKAGAGSAATAARYCKRRRLPRRPRRRCPGPRRPPPPCRHRHRHRWPAPRRRPPRRPRPVPHRKRALASAAVHRASGAMSAAIRAAMAGCRKRTADAVPSPGCHFLPFRPHNAQFITCRRQGSGVVSTVGTLRYSAMPRGVAAPFFPAILLTRNSFGQLLQLAFFCRRPGPMGRAAAGRKVGYNTPLCRCRAFCRAACFHRH